MFNLIYLKKKFGNFITLWPHSSWMIHGQLYLFYLKKASKWLFMARKVTKNDPMETGSSFKTRTGHSVEQSSCTLPQWASDCPPNAIGAEASRKSPKRRIADLFICENICIGGGVWTPWSHHVLPHWLETDCSLSLYKKMEKRGEIMHNTF